MPAEKGNGGTSAPNIHFVASFASVFVHSSWLCLMRMERTVSRRQGSLIQQLDTSPFLLVLRKTTCLDRAWASGIVLLRL